MADNTPSSRVRGPYRCTKRTPRQTRHNRARRLRMVDALSSTQEDDSRRVEVPNNIQIQMHGDHDDHHDDASAGGSPSTDDTEIPNNLQIPPSTSESDHIPLPSKLYPGSVVTAASSELAINSYISRHHLSKQAQEDMLQLIQLHLPEGSLVPSSVYTFRKHSLLNSVTAKNTCHYLCSQCSVSITDSSCQICPNETCAISISEYNLSSFFTISIAEQIQVKFKSKLGARLSVSRLAKYCCCLFSA